MGGAGKRGASQTPPEQDAEPSQSKGHASGMFDFVRSKAKKLHGVSLWLLHLFCLLLLLLLLLSFFAVPLLVKATVLFILACTTCSGLRPHVPACLF